jgi:hypothetical protein
MVRHTPENAQYAVRGSRFPHIYGPALTKMVLGPGGRADNYN